MRRYDPRFLWAIGLLHQLREITAENCKQKIIQASVIFKSYVLSDTAEPGLNKAIQAARNIRAFINPCLESENSLDELLRDPVGFDSWKKLLIMFFDQFESALSFDLEGLSIFVLEQKRGYSVRTLLSSIEDVLPEADRGLMSDFARRNMQEAGACLAYERYTGCGYHMARAIEDVGRRYDFAVTGNPSPYTDKNGKLRHRPLGQIGGDLKQRLDTWKGPNELKLLSLVVPTLQQFCRIYRDPLSHADPELKELDSNEAEIAFGHAIAAISTMLEDGRAGGPHFKSEPIWRAD